MRGIPAQPTPGDPVSRAILEECIQDHTIKQQTNRDAPPPDPVSAAPKSTYSDQNGCRREKRKVHLHDGGLKGSNRSPDSITPTHLQRRTVHTGPALFEEKQPVQGLGDCSRGSLIDLGTAAGVSSLAA
jgi:hypothetical protein